MRKVSRYRLNSYHAVFEALADAYSEARPFRWVRDWRGVERLWSAFSEKEFKQMCDDLQGLVGSGQTHDGFCYCVLDYEDFVLAFEILVEKYKLGKYVELV